MHREINLRNSDMTTTTKIFLKKSTTLPLGLPTGDNIRERNVGDIVNWSLEFTSN